MPKLVPVSSLALALAATTGCMVENTYVDRYDDAAFDTVDRGAPDFMYEGNLEVLAGHLRGDVGDVRGIDEEASVLTGYADPGFASVEVHADTRDGVAMNLVDIYGGLDALEPGLSQTFTADDDLGSGLSVQVLGCAGLERYEWTYDQPADEVQVRVSEGDTPDVMRVDYTARTFVIDPFTGISTGQADIVEGSFDVLR